MTVTTARIFPISPSGLAHIPRSWIHGGPDARSLCNYLTNVWGGKGVRWGTIDDAKRGCKSCQIELHKRVHWYEELKENIGGRTRAMEIERMKEERKALAEKVDDLTDERDDLEAEVRSLRDQLFEAEKGSDL